MRWIVVAILFIVAPFAARSLARSSVGVARSLAGRTFAAGVVAVVLLWATILVPFFVSGMYLGDWACWMLLGWYAINLVTPSLAILVTASELSAPEKKQPALHRDPSNYLELMFEPRPNDPVWKLVTLDNLGEYQKWFLAAERRAELGKLFSSNRIDDETDRKICDVVDEFAKATTLHPMILLILIHQFVDADHLLRQFWRGEWVVQMAQRPNYAPQPEAYVKYIKERFFESGSSSAG